MECFVIMPYGNSQKDEETAEKLNDIYDNWIKPTVEAITRTNGEKLTCHRGDKTPQTGDIIKHVLKNLKEADIVIADLSGRNPNVFYELGVRHSFKNNAILISENLDDIPFDLHGQNTIAYKYDPEKSMDFQNALRSALIHIINNPDEINNPVQEYNVKNDPVIPIPDGFIRPGYTSSQDPEFFKEIKKLIPEAKKITLIGTGLNLLEQKYILDLLLERTSNGEAEVTICFGNPFSPHVEDRLIEEEMWDNHPTVARPGMIRNTESLLKRLKSAGNPANFNVLLFEHYPTFATLIFDDKMYIYPYAYQKLGNSSPIFHMVDDGGNEFEFFKSNANRIVADAIPAKDVIMRYRKEIYTSDRWVGASVYLIPEKSDLLYCLGSELLGYDIWQKEEIPSVRFEPLRQYVGSAPEFGFHLTVADALLFANESSVERIKAELKVIVEEFSPFLLSEFNLVDGLDERRHIVLKCEDQTGTIEALHHEMVKRVYGMAISSYYARDRSMEEFYSDGKRNYLMMERYGAPFILDRFKPHFTLLANPPDEDSKRTEVLQILNDEINKLPKKKVPIKEIALVTRKPGESRWQVRDRFQLSKR